MASISAGGYPSVAFKLGCGDARVTGGQVSAQSINLQTHFLSKSVHISAPLPLPKRNASSSRISTVAKLSKGDSLPSFSLKDQDGRVVSSSKFKGKPIVLYFYPAQIRV